MEAMPAADALTLVEGWSHVLLSLTAEGGVEPINGSQAAYVSAA